MDREVPRRQHRSCVGERIRAHAHAGRSAGDPRGAHRCRGGPMTTESQTDTFSTDIAGLDESVPSRTFELADGETYDLRIAPVVKQIGPDRVRMIAYNGSVPGPTLRVKQGSEIIVRARNDG